MTNTTEARIARLARRIARMIARERAAYGAHVAARLQLSALAEVAKIRQRDAERAEFRAIWGACRRLGDKRAPR